MKNSEINKKFLNITDDAVVTRVLTNIAKNYKISRPEALAEVLDADAEHLCEYLVEPERSAVRLLMKRHGLA